MELPIKQLKIVRYEKDFPDTIEEYRTLKQLTANTNCFELPLAPGNTKGNIQINGDHRNKSWIPGRIQKKQDKLRRSYRF